MMMFPCVDWWAAYLERRATLNPLALGFQPSRTGGTLGIAHRDSHVKTDGNLLWLHR
jgi:hypothetical protein